MGKCSNAMFEWVNERLQGLRSRGATGRLDEERKELADAYRALDPAARASARENYRGKQAERARQAQARNATEADAARTALEEAGGDGRRWWTVAVARQCERMHEQAIQLM